MLFTVAVKGNGKVGPANFHSLGTVPVKAARPVKSFGQDSAALTYPMPQHIPVAFQRRTKELGHSILFLSYSFMAAFIFITVKVGNRVLRTFHLIFSY